MSSNGFNIEKLSGRDNYNTWAFAIKNLLLLEDLWDAVLETPLASSMSSIRKDDKAKAKIVLTIDPKLYVHIEQEETAKDTWDKLKSIFQDNGLDRRVGLVRQLVNTKLSNFTTTEEYVSAIMTVCHKLTNAGLKFDDEWTGLFMLAGLPDEYRPMLMGMESSGTKITSDFVKSKLLQDVVKKPVDEDIALATRHGNTNDSRKGKKKFFNRHEKKKFSNNHGKSKPNDAFISVLSASSGTDKDAWYIDSGASGHMSNNVKYFESMNDFNDHINTAGEEKIAVKGSGLVNLDLNVNGKSNAIDVKNVLFVPDLSTNLLSVSEMTSKGNKVIFEGSSCNVFNPKGQLIAKAEIDGGLYKLSQNPHKAFLSTKNADIDTWHRRLGHTNIQTLVRMQQGVVTGVNFHEKRIDSCITCSMGKQTRLPFDESRTRANELIELVHSDLCGPIEAESFRGSRFILSFIDDKSRKTFVYFLQYKSEVFEKFLEFKAMVEKQTGKKIKKFRSDNGGEYVNKKFQDYFKKSGIIHEFTCPYTPEQNGVSERMNRTIMEKVRCLLHDAGLDKKFWAEAVNCAVYLINRTPTSGSNVTPEEIWCGRKPDLSHLRIFGSKATSQIPKEKRKKLDVKAVEAILVGYGTNVKGYRLFNLETNEIFYSRNVTFLNEGGRIKSKSKVVQDNCVPISFTKLDESPIVEEILITDDEQHDTPVVHANKEIRKKKPIEDSASLRRSERIKKLKESQASSNFVKTDQTLSESCSVMTTFQNQPSKHGANQAFSNPLRNGGERDFQRKLNENFLGKDDYLLNKFTQQRSPDDFEIESDYDDDSSECQI